MAPKNKKPKDGKKSKKSYVKPLLTAFGALTLSETAGAVLPVG